MRNRLMTVVAVLVAVAAAGVAAQDKPTDQTQREVEEFRKGAVAPKTPGLATPVATKMVKPVYTPNAMREKIQGTVTVEAVIGADGKVVRARVVRSLDRDSGLDDEAVKAITSWEFKPGVLEGRSVPVWMEFQMEFRLH
jgi:TonB family protein